MPRLLSHAQVILMRRGFCRLYLSDRFRTVYPLRLSRIDAPPDILPVRVETDATPVPLMLGVSKTPPKPPITE